MKNSTLGQIARHPCEIQRLVEKAGDEDIQGVDEWETIAKTRIGFPQQVGGIYANRELLQNRGMMTRNVQYAEMQWPGFEIDSTMRLICRGGIYAIRGVEDVEGRYRKINMVVVREDGP